MNKILVALMFAYFIIINIHLFRMFFARKNAVKVGEIKPSFFKAYDSECPDYLKVIGNHMNNQFQMPIIFFIVGTLAIAVKTVTMMTVLLAAIFVVSRIFHSIVFLTSNNVLNRAKYYAIGLLTLNVMWFEVLIRVLLK